MTWEDMASHVDHALTVQNDQGELGGKRLEDMSLYCIECGEIVFSLVRESA